MTTIPGVARRVAIGAALVLAALGAACKGNVNDDSVPVLDITLVGRSVAGEPANSSCNNASVSYDGNIVAFETYASNMDPMDGNSERDVFVREVQSGMTKLVSMNAAGTGSGNSYSEDPSVSPDGRFVAFVSYANNLVSGVGDAGINGNIFVRDLWNDVTAPVDVIPAGTAVGNASTYERPAVVSDDNYVYVIFCSSATNLGPTNASASQQVYLRRIPIISFSTFSTGITVMVSRDTGALDSNGGNYRPVAAQDGTYVYVAWHSSATDLNANDDTSGYDVYYRVVDKSDLTLVGSSATLVSVSSGNTEGNGSSSMPAISANGLYVAFESGATDLVAGDTNGKRDIYVRDIAGGSTARASLSASGEEPLEDCYGPSISGDGRFVAFETDSINIITGDTNAVTDVFLRDMTPPGTTILVSMTVFMDQTQDNSYNGMVTGNGEFVFFRSSSPNIVPGVLFASTQVYRRRM